LEGGGVGKLPAGKHNSFKAGKEKTKQMPLKSTNGQVINQLLWSCVTNPFKGLDGDFKGIKIQNQRANDS
jgi:hypothetical protein